MAPQGKEKLLFELHAEVCKAMSSSKRLEIIMLLSQQERHVDDLADKMGASKANVSQHLAILREKGVVVPRREGLHVFYRIANPKIVQACTLMREVMLEKLIGGAEYARLLPAEPMGIQGRERSCHDAESPHFDQRRPVRNGEGLQRSASSHEPSERAE